MGDSAVYHDHESTSPVEAAHQITHPEFVRPDENQSSSLLSPKKDELGNLNSTSVDSSNFDQGQIKYDTQKEAGGTDKHMEECSKSLNCCGDYCSLLNPLDAHDMTRCISGDLPTFSNVETSSFLLVGIDPDRCVGAQVYFSEEADGKSLMDVDIDMKVHNLPPELQDEQGKNILSSELPQNLAGVVCSSKIDNKSLPALPVNEFESSGSSCLFDERSNEESCGDPQTEATDKDKTLDNDFDDSLSYLDVLTLDQLDDDVLYHIASFLEARVLWFALSNVCQRFRAMFGCESYWRMRISHRWPKQFPAIPNPPHFNWIDAYVEREDNYRVWTDVALNKHHLKYSFNLFGGVDAVHLMNDGQLAVCGDRSRTLNLIDFSKYRGPGSNEEMLKEMQCHTDRVIHQGWIWSIASSGNRFVTGSWDTYVRLFDVEAGCKLNSSFKCHSSVLCLYAENNETVASCSDKKVYFCDHRTSNVQSKTFHTQPVLCVAGNENYIISGSEDKSVSVYDRRAGKIFIMFKLKNYPFCMSYTDDQLWFGDRNGTLHLHDGTNGLFQNVGSYDIGHTEKMTCVVSTRGAIFTCSGDKTIKVLHPTQDPDPITTLSVHEKEIAKIDYNSGVLVSAGGDDCIGVWLPKHWGRDTYLL